jgi:hypothetical protein
MELKLYNWDSVFDFGKYKSENITVKEVYEKGDITYLLWLLTTSSNVCFSDDVFETLKNNNVASDDLVIALLEDKVNASKVISKIELLGLEIIHLKKKLELNNVL